MPRKRAVMTDAERAELPSSLFILSGTNFVRRAAVWLSRWILFEWIIILTIIGKPKYSFSLFVCLLSLHGLNGQGLPCIPYGLQGTSLPHYFGALREDKTNPGFFFSFSLSTLAQCQLFNLF